MALRTFYTLDVFTDQPFSGNPLAVIQDSEDLSDEQMQKMASEFNLSETVFLSKKNDATNEFNVKIYTPQKELPFAGHPLIGAASLLSLLGKTRDASEFVFHVGGVAIPASSTKEKNNLAKASFVSPYVPRSIPVKIKPETLAEALSIKPGDILTDRDIPLLFECGSNFLFVPVRNKDSIKRCYPNLSVWNPLMKELNVDVVYAFTYLTTLPKTHLHARAFCPHGGIMEDSATGSAVNALSGYICAVHKNPGKKISKVIEQGFEMNRRSIIYLDFDLQSGQPASVRISGNSVLIQKGSIAVP